MGLFLSKRDVRNVLREELAPINSLLLTANTKLIQIMATQAEIAQAIRDHTATVRKAVDEVLAKIAMLEEAVRNNPPAQEVADAVQALGVAVRAADDVVPDAPPPPP